MPKNGVVDEPILIFVKRRLEEARGYWPHISTATGVPYFTITNIVQGKVDDPRVSTVQRLVDYFHARDAEAAKLKANTA
jgi:predicted transcriptional regulator